MSHRLLVAASFLVVASARAGETRFDFRRDPGRQGFVVAGADDGRFPWSRAREVAALLDSTSEGARLVAPLGATVDGSTSFVLEVDLRLDAIDASPDDFFQLSFGLVSSETTGLNRTGTSLPGPPFFVDDADTWDCVELAYFPNVTSFGGPTLQPTVFGGNVGSPFANFAANFGPSADLGDNTGDAVRELPVGVPLRIRLAHDACRQSLVTTILDLSSPRPVVLETGLLPLDLSFLNATSTFRVDSFAVNAYQDLADFDPSSRSLLARVAFLGARLELPDEASATLLPRGLNGGAGGDALVRIEGVLAATDEGAPAVVLVEAGGLATSVPLDAAATGRTIHARIPRSLAAASGLVVEVAGCRIPVEGARAVPGP